MTDKVQKIREAVEKRYKYWKEKEFNSHSIESEIRMSECNHLLLMLNSLQEEPVSYDLVKFADCTSIDYRNQREKCGLKDPITLDEVEEANYNGIMAGAKWQKEQMMAKAINAVVSQVPCSNEIILYNPASVHWSYLPQEMNKLGLNKGDKVKVIVIKED